MPISDGSKTYTLTALKKKAFHCRLAMTSIVLPNTVTTIGEQAFNGCSNLTGTITIPSSVTIIGTTGDGTGAFNSVGTAGDGVTVVLSEGLVTIGKTCFKGANLVGKITIPSTVTKIYDQAFYNCSNLTSLVFTDANDPNAAMTINKEAFYGCRKLAGTITIPSSVTTIGTSNENGVFNSAGIDGAGVTIVLREGLTLIGKNCFKGANLLGTVAIPSTMTNIYDCAFYNCTNLTQVAFADANDPNAVMKIGQQAFYGCYNLTGSITIPSSVTTIGAQAFFGCRKLAGMITIPGSVKTLGTPGDGGGVFNSVGKDGDGVTLVLSEGLTLIGQHCFKEANLLGKITIPSTVTNISNTAFHYCANLTEIEFARAAAASPNVVLGTFLNQNAAVTKVTMPANLKSVAANAFKSPSTGRPSTFDVYWRNYPNNDAGTALPNLFDGKIPGAITFYIPWQDATWATFFSNQNVTLPEAYDGSVVWNTGWSGSPAVTVKYWHDPFTLTWNMNGGLLNGDGNDVVGSGQFGAAPVAPGNPEKESKVFVGWNTDPAASEPLDLASVVIIADMTFYAIYVDARVSWYDEDGTTPLSSAVSYLAAGAQPTRENPSKSNILAQRSFLGWRRVGGADTVIATANLPVVAAGDDVAYKAVYSAAQYADFIPEGFAKGIVLTVSGYAKAPEDRAALQNFPVLVRISETGISGFDYDDVLVSGGGDIRFADANGNALPFEKDTWRDANDESLFWVTLPEMTNGTQFIMFYGASQNDANAFADPADTGRMNPWNEYTGVWHLGDSGDGSGVPISDSTTNRLNGTTGGSTGKYMSNGAVGGARKITTDGNNKPKDQISVSLTDSKKKAVVDALVPQFTVSLWYRLASSSETDIQWDYLIGRKPSEKAATSGGWAIQMSDPSTGGGVKNGIRLWSSETNDSAPAGTAIPVIGKDQWTTKDVWFKLDTVYNNNTYSLYTNGVLLASAALKGNAINGNTTFLGIGGAASAGGIRPFTGDMDEVRLRCGTVSEDWVVADYATQTSPSFLSAGGVESVGASTKPIAEFSILDKGAAFIQVSGKVTLLGEGADACTLSYMYWEGNPPAETNWTPFATGVGVGETVTDFIVGLDPLKDYHITFKASNNLATPVDSDIQTEPFTTSGVGDAGESGGESERQLDEFVHTFTVTERGVSEFEFTPPTGVTKVEALVVAGGGAGGYFHGGGGGGGGLVHDDALAVVPGQTYTINVGTGGLASASVSVYGGNGGDSSIVLNGVALVSATGGGAGGNGGSNKAGKAGGSSGGSSDSSSPGNAMAGQGYAGAKGNGNQAGGGGGSEETGFQPVEGGTKAVSAGSGGNGRSFRISGENITYAGGGGGGGIKSLQSNTYGTPGIGGLGGGGMGGQETDTTDTEIAQNGTDGLGGGGGGGSAVSGKEKGGNGGNGVVIIRYGAGGDGDGVIAPTISLTGLTYADTNDTTGEATVTYRVGWAGYGHDYADVLAIWGYSEDDLENTNAVASTAIGQGTGSFTLTRVNKTVYVRLVATNATDSGTSPEIKSVVITDPKAPVGEMTSATPDATRVQFAASVTGFGDGEGSLTGEFQICSDRFFDAGTYTSFSASETLTGIGTLTGSATGLSPNTVYWVRAVFVKVIGGIEEHSYETAPISFTTTRPAGVRFLIY